MRGPSPTCSVCGEIGVTVRTHQEDGTHRRNVRTIVRRSPRRPQGRARRPPPGAWARRRERGIGNPLVLRRVRAIAPAPGARASFRLLLPGER